MTQNQQQSRHYKPLYQWCFGTAVCLACGNPRMAYAGEKNLPEALNLKPSMVIIYILVLLGLALFITIVNYLFSLCDQNEFNKIDLKKGRSAAQQKMSKRALSRKVAFLGVLITCIIAVVLGFKGIGWFGWGWGIIMVLIGGLGGVITAGVAASLLILRKTYLTIEEQVKQKNQT